MYFNPNLLQIPHNLTVLHPSQNGLSVKQFHNMLDYYYQMCAIILNQKENYDLEATQNMYIANMDNAKLIFDKVDQDCKSANKKLQDRYENCSFPHTISQIVSEISAHCLFDPFHQNVFPLPMEVPLREIIILSRQYSSYKLISSLCKPTS